jgi:hypothetical protein
MCKLKISNIILYLFSTCIALYILIMFKNQDFKLLEKSNLIEGHSLIYFTFVMLPFPLLIIILFYIPMFYVFKIKNVFIFCLVINIILIAQYLVYTFMTSRKLYDMNGVYYIVLSYLFLVIFFHRQIKSKFNEKSI